MLYGPYQKNRLRTGVNRLVRLSTVLEGVWTVWYGDAASADVAASDVEAGAADVGAAAAASDAGDVAAGADVAGENVVYF